MWKALQGPLAFVLGFATFIHEVVLTSGDRPYILTAALALMGFPFVLGFEKGIIKRPVEGEKREKDE